jgi:hypothetical protein
MSRVVKFAIAFALFGQAVLAQPQPPAATAPSAPSSDADVAVRQRASLSPQEMLTQGQDYRTRMDVIVKQIEPMISEAQRQKDVIRLNCLTDKLLQIRANVRIGDDALQALREAAARQDQGGALHEYTRVTIVHQKAQVLGSEAQACVGEDLSYVGATRVDVDVSGLPPEDPTLLPPPFVVMDRPPLASPSR